MKEVLISGGSSPDFQSDCLRHRTKIYCYPIPQYVGREAATMFALVIFRSQRLRTVLGSAGSSCSRDVQSWRVTAPCCDADSAETPFVSMTAGTRRRDCFSGRLPRRRRLEESVRSVARRPCHASPSERSWGAAALPPEATTAIGRIEEDVCYVHTSPTTCRPRCGASLWVCVMRRRIPAARGRAEMQTDGRAGRSPGSCLG